MGRLPSHRIVDPSIQVVTHFPSLLLDKLEDRARRDGQTRSEVIREAVTLYLEAR